MNTLSTFISQHHEAFKLLGLIFALWIFPALTHAALTKAKMLPKGSRGDLVLRAIMKKTLDTTSYDVAADKLDKIVDDLIEGKPLDDLKDGKATSLPPAPEDAPAERKA